MKISGILSTKGVNVVTVRPDQSIRQALALLGQHNIGALVVVSDEGIPVGMLSERDIVRQAARDEKLFSLPVGRVMTENVITGSPHDDLDSVLQLMTEKRFRHLPVVEQEHLVGIVSIGDVVKAMLMQYQGEIDTLQTQIMSN